MDIVARIHRIGQIIQLRSDAVLAGELLISGAGATKRIKKLLDAGLVQRDTNPQDGRGALVRMTPKAHTLLRPILVSVLHFEAGLLAALDAPAASRMAADLRGLLPVPGGAYQPVKQ